MSSWGAWADGVLAEVRAAGRWRAPRDLSGGAPATTIAATGRQVVSFASNDYLGLSQHPAVIAAAHEALDRYGAGAGAARLVVGSRPVHSELEAALADWKGTERAVLFPTGFAANLGLLSTLGGAGGTSGPGGGGVRIVSDELNHASIIDGCRLARAEVAVYRHADADHAAALLKGAERAIVVTDTVFSMDGDVAPVAELAAVCAAAGALLVLDEAHAVLGPDLDGDLTDAGVAVLRVGTLSKTLGALGGFVAGPASFCDLLVNRARPYIFTTASTPADTAAALAALRIVRSQAGQELRARLRGHVETVRPGHPSPIVPVVLGSEERALAAADALLDLGLLVPAIRPPTVPVGTSRLRVALSAAHTAEEVMRLATALTSLDADAA
jgi:8-amino-7-oxononanoate synthase